MKKIMISLITVCLIIFSGGVLYANTLNNYEITLSNNAIIVNGKTASGSTNQAVYTSKVKETHSGVDESLKDVINTVIHITKAGTYHITGAIEDGQIYVNAGDNDAVTLVLDNVTINCRTAPAILIKNAYDPKKAGDAGVIIKLADNSTNNISGAEAEDNDAALSTDISVAIEGNGTLHITSTGEGIETKQHFTVNSGNLIINSTDDAINGSEDGVSHLTFNGGYVYAAASKGIEGDAIDSNGYVTINGGTVVALAHPTSQDGALDADLGVIINGGTVVGVGNMQSELSSSSAQQYIQLVFAAKQTADTLVTITDAKGNVITAFNAPQTFTSIVFSTPDLKDGTYYAYTQGEIAGDVNNGLYSNITSFQNGVQQQHFGSAASMNEGRLPLTGLAGERPEGMEPPTELSGERPEGMEPPTRPDGERPKGMRPPTALQGQMNQEQWPEGMTRPDWMPESSESENAIGSIEFTINSTAKTFRGVRDNTTV